MFMPIKSMLLWMYFVNSNRVFEVFSLLFTNSSWISWKFLNFSSLECFLRIHSSQIYRILIHCSCMKTLKPRKRDKTAKISEAGRKFSEFRFNYETKYCASWPMTSQTWFEEVPFWAQLPSFQENSISSVSS